MLANGTKLLKNLQGDFMLAMGEELNDKAPIGSLVKLRMTKPKRWKIFLARYLSDLGQDLRWQIEDVRHYSAQISLC